MAHHSTTAGQPVSFSFKEYRDEELVVFFANENRSFRPFLPPAGTSSRSRTVGTPHFSIRSDMKSSEADAVKHKPTAAFVRKIRPYDVSPEEFSSNRASERDSERGVDGERQSGHPSSDIGSRNATWDGSAKNEYTRDEYPAIRVARPEKQILPKRKMTAEPSFGKSTRPLGALLANGRKENRAAKIICDPLEKGSGVKSIRPFLRTVGLSLSKPGKRPNGSDEIAPVIPIPIEPADVRHDEPFASRQTIDSEAEQKTEQHHPPVEDVEGAIRHRLSEVDEQLQRLVESWPKLSDRLKETIRTLVEVSHKDRETS